MKNTEESRKKSSLFEPILEISFFDYSLGGYSYRERWARTKRCFFMNNGAKKATEALGSIITPIGREFYQSRLNNPNIFRIEIVKQGCDI
jgi:hypothetical protein